MSAAKTKRAGFAGDHPLIGVVVASFLLLGVGSSFGLSAIGLWHLAGTMGVEGFWRLLLVFVIDGIIIGATGAILLLRGRGQATWFLWGVVFLFTGISAWANFTSHQMQGQDVASSAMGAFMPLALLVATEVAIIALVRGEGEAPERKQRKSKVAPAIPAAPWEVAPAPKPVTKPRPAVRTAPRVAIEDASPEASLLLAEFSTLMDDPSSKEQRTPAAIRLNAVTLELVDDHGITPADLAAHAPEGTTPDSIRMRASRERKRALVSA